MSTKKRRRDPFDRSIRIVQLPDNRQEQELRGIARQFRSTLTFEGADEEITEAKQQGRP